ncbi:PREDICTED: adenylate isopentenyltransferase 5, chloroplastic-like [Nelumbo nucifera]|uniref:Adenylate isopentenyltransferase 5, chloroplastic-like n=1 Tax=Nelumbo nucifera TaxID=4432 RepID=A0A1U8B8H2_NELNU|nr:PREDICTED: adenylate isopentenyltransferase 5, chloroplastic-like [Nelumbo nucifera]
MVEAGLVDEVRRFFEPEADYSQRIRQAIWVPEMDGFLRAEAEAPADEETLARLIKEVIEEIKEMHCLNAIRSIEARQGSLGEAGGRTRHQHVRHFFYKAENHGPTASAAATTIKAAVMGKVVAAATR